MLEVEGAGEGGVDCVFEDAGVVVEVEAGGANSLGEQVGGGFFFDDGWFGGGGEGDEGGGGCCWLGCCWLGGSGEGFGGGEEVVEVIVVDGFSGLGACISGVIVWVGREVLDVQTDDRWGLRHGRGRERRRCCRRGRRPSMARLAGEERHVSDL